LLRFRSISQVPNQPTSDNWELGIESFSFCKYQFASSVVAFQPRVIHTWCFPYTLKKSTAASKLVGGSIFGVM
jgi:hypothetical protein